MSTTTSIPTTTFPTAPLSTLRQDIIAVRGTLMKVLKRAEMLALITAPLNPQKRDSAIRLVCKLTQLLTKCFALEYKITAPAKKATTASTPTAAATLSKAAVLREKFGKKRIV